MVKYFTAKYKCLHSIIAKTPSWQLKNSKASLVSFTVHRWFGDNDVTCSFSLCTFLCVQCSCDFEDEMALVSVIPVEFLGTQDVAPLWILSVLMSCQQPWQICPHGLHGDGKNWGEAMNLLSCFLYSAVLMTYG